MSFSASNDINGIRSEINQALTDFVTNQGKYLRTIGPELDPVAVALEKFSKGEVVGSSGSGSTSSTSSSAGSGTTN